MNKEHSFTSLSCITPGESTVGEVTSRFGPFTVSETSESGLYFGFDGHGVGLFVYHPQRIALDSIVDEVRIMPPNADVLPCGIRLGQPQTDALRAVKQSYQVTNEYEDAIYFRPSTRDDLLASVEFLDEGVVVCVELMFQSASDKAGFL